MHRRLKNRKAPGIFGITAEMLKVGGDVGEWYIQYQQSGGRHKL